MIPNLHLAVASEVATMVYLRSMGIPVPEVYGYSARKDNEAGTEFIFTEFMEGKNVAEVLDELGERDVIGILKQVVDLEKRMMEINFPAGGSLYFAEDLENVPGRVSGPIKGIPLEDKQFCLGPETSYPLWFGRRSQLDVDRGPCMSYLFFIVGHHRLLMSNSRCNSRRSHHKRGREGTRLLAPIRSPIAAFPLHQEGNVQVRAPATLISHPEPQKISPHCTVSPRQCVTLQQFLHPPS